MDHTPLPPVPNPVAIVSNHTVDSVYPKPKRMLGTAVPGVTASYPFRTRVAVTTNYDPDHWCNACGRYVSVIAGWNSDGTHRHKCPCGNEWVH